MAVPKILIIDDEPALQKAMQKILKNENYDISIANNGLEGLAHLGKEQVDLIFLDLRMPGLDGFDVLEKINGASKAQNIFNEIEETLKEEKGTLK